MDWARLFPTLWAKYWLNLSLGWDYLCIFKYINSIANEIKIIFIFLFNSEIIHFLAILLFISSILLLISRALSSPSSPRWPVLAWGGTGTWGLASFWFVVWASSNLLFSFWILYWMLVSVPVCSIDFLEFWLLYSRIYLLVGVLFDRCLSWAFITMMINFWS